MKSLLPSPAIAIVGRHNSGKTTLIEKLIAHLAATGLDVGSVKHHGHAGFDIDIPGKDSYRHRQAGASETVIACPGQMALIRTTPGEMECSEIVSMMPGHDLVLVEGYRKSGLPTFEVMRAGNPADEQVAAAFREAAVRGDGLDVDFVQQGRARQFGLVWHAQASLASADAQGGSDVDQKMPTAHTMAVVTDIPQAREAARIFGIDCFGLDDIEGICRFLTARIARPRVSVVVQAGGESRRMGQSKATVKLAGQPLVERLVERMLPVADEILVTTNEEPELRFLHDVFPDANIRLVPDVLDRRGALSGALTALEHATYDYVAMVACDMVFASPRLVAAECAELNTSGADCVVPVNKHGFEPLHAVYYRPHVLPVVRRLTEAGESRLQSIFEHLDVCAFPQARVLEAEPAGGCFINVNTPEELAQVERNYLSE